MEMKEVYLGLGSNQGDKNVNLQTALNEILDNDNIILQAASSIYLTKAWGNVNQEDFLNQVIKIKTSLSALELLTVLQKIEIKMGRQRLEKWGPRNIDLDILLYGNEIIDLPELKVPHPYLQQRLFVLIPMQEIDDRIIFPDNGMEIREVLNRVSGQQGYKGIKKMT